MYAITESIWRWRQYLLGRRFLVHTDHQSLRSLLHQTVQTPDQHRWLTKLLGYEFDIIYKPGAQNKQADALSRVYEDTQPMHCAFAVTTPQPAILASLKHYFQTTPHAAELLTSVRDDPLSWPDYSTQDGLVLFKGRLFILTDTAL